MTGKGKLLVNGREVGLVVRVTPAVESDLPVEWRRPLLAPGMTLGPGTVLADDALVSFPDGTTVVMDGKPVTVTVVPENSPPPRIELREVQPIGTALAFADAWDKQGNQTVGGVAERPVYPYSSEGDRLREHRQAMGLTLRQAADRMGLRVTELSGLELGSLEPVNGWDAVFRVLDPELVQEG